MRADNLMQWACEPIALVGMAGRFPDATGISELWQMLLHAGVAIREFKRDELLQSGLSVAVVDDPTYLPVGTEVENIDCFDADYFGISAAEARLIDPQHRVFLECVHAALDDAAVDGIASVGVFAGSLWSTYLFCNIIPGMKYPGSAPPKSVMVANDKDFLCTRVSYRLGLTGPAISVQTACSTSLVAVHLACQALQSRSCDVAVAGGVSITVPQLSGYFPHEDPTFSRDGRCRPLDCEASGMVMGNGCAVVVLKRLADALADRDHVYAVVRGIATCNDGAAKVGYTAPSVAGLRSVIRSAVEVAEIEPERIGYVEMHGSGTWLGDCVEMRALSDAYAAARAPAADCLIGSVKANIGNLAMAAGATGLIKTALILERQIVPPQAGFSSPHVQLRLNDIPFAVPTTATHCALKAAAVTATGGGGTNVHCILESAPERARRAAPLADYVVGISAPDADGLRQVAATLRTYLTQSSGIRIDDLAYTLATGRRRRVHRHAFVAQNIEQLTRALDHYLVDDQPTRHPLAAEWTGSNEPELLRLGAFDEARHISLPSYPWRRQRHWIDPPGCPPTADTNGSRS